MTKYGEIFEDLLKSCQDSNLYIGTGNPNARILIIGKEASIDSAVNLEQYKREILNNFGDWKNNFENNVQQINGGLKFNVDYNPIYPYQGQINKIENKNTGHNGGTSRTWYYYQNLIDSIFSEGIKSNVVNFHESCFITELNQITGRYSHLIPKKKRIASINERTSLLKHDFFQEFEIVIVAVGHYVRDFGVNLEDIFAVKFDGITIDLGQNNWINVHHHIEGNKPKLLIHTNQLSMIKSELIEKLAHICKVWLSQH